MKPETKPLVVLVTGIVLAFLFAGWVGWWGADHSKENYKKYCEQECEWREAEYKGHRFNDCFCKFPDGVVRNVRKMVDCERVRVPKR